MSSTTVKLPINTDTLLILEKAFESSDGHQQAIENLNVLEQFLVGIIENLNQNHPSFRANFIIRRLPVFTIPFFTKNEYAIILENLDFTLSSPNPSVSETASIDGKPIKVKLGHTEIFTRETEEEPLPSTSREQNWDNSCSRVYSSNKAYYSHEIFQRFSSAFLKAFNEELERDTHKKQREGSEIEKVQLIGPHLLHSLKCHPEVDKIFTLTQPDLILSPKKKSKCKIEINQQSSILTIELEGVEITVRPGVFLKNGYPKLNNFVLERIPLYHPLILNIAEALAKGCLLFPTNFETLWTIQFWPSESHLIFSYHPSSIVSRVFKLYGSYCLNPIHFWEILNSCFLIGVEDTETLKESTDSRFLSMDFLTSSFLHELEQLPQITDWEPKNFSSRFTSLLSTAVDAHDKGFHSHYFTKCNVLRNIWRKQRESIDLEEQNGACSTCPPSRLPSNLFEDDEDEFGLHLDELSLESRDDHAFSGPLRRKSTLDSTVTSSKEGVAVKDETKQTRSLSKYIGATLMRRFSMFGGGESDPVADREKKHRSMTDIAAGFEEMVNQQRREETFRSRTPGSRLEAPLASEEVFASTLAFAETSFTEHGATNGRDSVAGIENRGYQSKDSIYTTILQFLNEISPSNYLSNPELITHLDNCRRILNSQGELIAAWTQVINEIPKPKHICPHSFSPRQIQSISLVIQAISKVSSSNSSIHITASNPRLPTWEIIGNLLRSALHQMRSEGKLPGRESIKVKRRKTGLSFKSLRSKSFTEGSLSSQPIGSTRVSKFSFRAGSYDVCKHHREIGGLDPETETALAMEDPETAATHRLLEWLWQLRNSEIGRLSHRAKKYIETLFYSSIVQSHFLEQFTEAKIYESMGIRSAVAVSRIMSDEKYSPLVPLVTASKRGWQWAEMLISFVAWNEEKRNPMKARVPLINSSGFVLRELNMDSLGSGPAGGQQTLKRIHNPTEPDTEALNLAFHSELATPLGMHDFEEPQRPGPYAVAILIFSSMGYFSQWEVVPGNIVHALVRLQKFSVLQHIGTMLLPPHRKTALNEVRKLNKTFAFSAYQFDDNVMTKTFKRLASLRHTRRLFSNSCKENKYTCEEIGCPMDNKTTVGNNIQCTKL